MAMTITWDQLRDLATFRASNGCAISLYLDLDPSVSPTVGDAWTRINSLLDEVGKSQEATREDLTHAQRQGIRADIERVRRYFEQEFDREGARGVAVFSAGLDGFWKPMAITESVPDRVRVGRELHLAPLVPLVGRGTGALVVAVGRERGEVHELRNGRLEQIANLFDHQPRRHDQGGWSQARMQRHVDTLAQEHLREVAEELGRQVRRSGQLPVVVVAPEETRAEFTDLLPSEARQAVVGWTHAEAHAGPPELLAAAAPVLERWRIEQEHAVVERWREEAGRNGRAASGWASTLEAASDGRVEQLLYTRDARREAMRCPQCGRLSATAATCPLDGAEMERCADGLDLALHQVLAHGGTAAPVGEDGALAGTDGIAALLRY